MTDYSDNKPAVARQRAVATIKASAQSTTALSYVNQRASSSDYKQLQAMIDASPRQNSARKAIPVELSINGRHPSFGSKAGPTIAGRDQRADKGAAGSTVAGSVTKTEGQNAVGRGAFGMVSPTHTTTIASAHKTDGHLVVALNHGQNLDMSFGSGLGTDVGAKDGLKSVKKANWAEAKQDLTPNAVGKPPRTAHYSAQYLRDHENNHILESEAATQVGITEAADQLRAQVISDVDFQDKDAGTLAEPLRARAEALIRNKDYRDYMGADYGFIVEHAQRPGEIRTYAKGMGDYQALANKIDEHATRAGWQGEGRHQPHSKKTKDINSEKRSKMK